MITVASYNIRKSLGTDRKRNPERILEVIAEIDADIIALQEVDKRFGRRVSTLPAEIFAKTGYQPIAFGEDPEGLGWHGNTILARRSVQVLHLRRWSLPSLEPRGAAVADLRIDGIDIRVVGMHLGLMGHWRKQQAKTVLAELEALEASMPTVMMGDLNQWGRAGGALAHFAESHHVAAPGPSYHSRVPVAELDRIITSPDLVVEQAGVHTSELARLASDHLPVWARLSFAGQRKS